MEWGGSWTDGLLVPITVRDQGLEHSYRPELLVITDPLSHCTSAGQPSTLIHFRPLFRAHRMDWSESWIDVSLVSRASLAPVLEVFKCLELPHPAQHTHMG